MQDLRHKLATRVQDVDYERHQSELQQTIDQLASKLDIADLALEQIRLRMGEQDQLLKDRWRDVTMTQDRQTQDTRTGLKSLRDSLSNRIDQLESRIVEMPKSIEVCATDLRKLKSETVAPLTHSVSILQKDVSRVRGDVQRCVGERDVDAVVSNAVAAIKSRLERAIDDIADLRGVLDDHCRIHAKDMYRTTTSRPITTQQLDRNVNEQQHDDVTSPTMVPGSFYKPAHLAFSSGSSQPQIGPSANSADSVPSTSNSVKSIQSQMPTSFKEPPQEF
eukprot:jgi/Hompol1/2679/HPOL_006118-RA